MDRLVLTLAFACQRVEAVEARRIVDAKERRLPLQKKVGAGLSRDEFSALVASGEVKHHGLPESAVMIADSLELCLEEIEETIEPVIAETEVQTEFLTVQPGEVAGIKQIARGSRGEKEIIRLELQIYAGADDPRDEVKIAGCPSLHCQIPGGLHGDLATAAIVVNSIPALLDARPGLHTLRDFPLSHFTGRLEARST
jgi:4-hydroxy-tetrahydrodipicolinate reductase